MTAKALPSALIGQLTVSLAVARESFKSPTPVLGKRCASFNITSMRWRAPSMVAPLISLVSSRSNSDHCAVGKLAGFVSLQGLLVRIDVVDAAVRGEE